MARPKKCRKVCALPENAGFAPIKRSSTENRVIMSVDEYEAIRLIDLVGYTQEECAVQMHIARTTVQGIYNEARGKLADALVNGRMLQIKGGDFDLCNQEAALCGEKCQKFCRKRNGNVFKEM